MMNQCRWLSVAATGMALLFVAGCTDHMAKSLGGLPVVVSRQSSGEVLADVDLMVGDQPLMRIYHVDQNGRFTTEPTTSTGVYRIADVSELDRHFYLGLEPTNIEGLKQRRQIIAMKLLDIADTNGSEYWRRFAGLITYAKAARAGEKALTGAGIAATFISPVLGAALAGSGLAVDTFTEQLTAGFDIEVYTALREAVRAEVERRRKEILVKLSTREYNVYPASAVVAEVSDYAYIYSIRGAVDALKRVTKSQADQEQAPAAPAAPAATTSTPLRPQ